MEKFNSNVARQEKEKAGQLRHTRLRALEGDFSQRGKVQRNTNYNVKQRELERDSPTGIVVWTDKLSFARLPIDMANAY